MDPLRKLTELERDLTVCDCHIADLQLQLKGAKKAREEKVTEIRAAIRDADRPMLSILLDETKQEPATV